MYLSYDDLFLVMKTWTLKPKQELRIEFSCGSSLPPVQLEVTSGTAEIYGSELAKKVVYSFPTSTASCPRKLAVFSWHGCVIKTTDPASTEDDILSVYLASDSTAMPAFLNSQYAHLRLLL